MPPLKPKPFCPLRCRLWKYVETRHIAFELIEIFTAAIPNSKCYEEFTNWGEDPPSRHKLKQVLPIIEILRGVNKLGRRFAVKHKLNQVLPTIK
jgi:hypothetical protein